MFAEFRGGGRRFAPPPLNTPLSTERDLFAIAKFYLFFSRFNKFYTVNCPLFSLLSVCLSVTRFTQNFLQHLFTTPDRPGIWLDCEKNSAKILFAAVFSRRCYVQCKREYTNRDFQAMLRFISETIQDMAIVTLRDK